MSRRDASMRVFMSGRIHWMPWDWPQGWAKGSRGDPDAPRVEHMHGDLEAFAFFAEAILDRAAVIVIHDLARGRGADAQLRFGLTLDETRPLRIDDESRYASVPSVRSGHREQDKIIGDGDHYVINGRQTRGASGPPVAA